MLQALAGIVKLVKVFALRKGGPNEPVKGCVVRVSAMRHGVTGTKLSAAGGGGTTALQLLNLALAMRVFQLKLPVGFMYSPAYQKVQSALGSVCMGLYAPHRERL